MKQQAIKETLKTLEQKKMKVNEIDTNIRLVDSDIKKKETEIAST